MNASVVWKQRGTLLLMAVSVVLALVAAVFLFPDGSPNHDESAYLAQAEALREGHITLPASTHDPYFLPFLSAVDDERVVFKYQPTWPAYLAAVRSTTGSYLPALALSAAATTGMVSWFAWELTRRRRVALAATALFALSPFVVVQSGTYLAYLTSTALVAAAGAALLRARAQVDTAWYVAGGALFGLAAFHRAFDAVLFAIPFVVWFLLAPADDAAPRSTRLLQIAAGASPFVLLVGAYNWAATGSPLRMPFTVAAPLDTFGFGERASFGSGAAGIEYDVGTAFVTIGEFAGALHRWIIGGFVALALAVLAVVFERRRRGVLLAAGLALVFPAGYFFWWGTGNAVRFRLEDLLGPFYWLPALPALCVLTVVGGAWLWERQRIVCGALVAGAFVVGVTAWPSTYRAVDEAAAAETRIAELHRRVPRGSLLLEPPQFGPDRYANTIVSPDLSGDRLVAFLPDQPAARFELMDRFPDRPVFEMFRTRPWDDFFTPHTLRVREAGAIRAAAWNLTIEVANPHGAETAIAYLRVGEVRVEVPLPALGEEFRPVSFRVGAGPETERVGPVAITIEEGTATRVAAGVALGTSAALDDLDWFELRWDVSAEPDGLRIQDPPSEWQRVVFPGVVFGEAEVNEFVRTAG